MFLAGITLITAGVTYAFYSYSKSGSTESTIRSGKVTLHYDEGGMQGISLSDALPMSDEQGKVQTQYFEFRITSDTISFEIPSFSAAISNSVKFPNNITPCCLSRFFIYSRCSLSR